MELPPLPRWPSFAVHRPARGSITYSTRHLANPGFSLLHATLVASYANLDRLEAARAAARRLLEITPGFTVSGFARMALARPQLMDAFVQALRKAGLPE